GYCSDSDTLPGQCTQRSAAEGASRECAPISADHRLQGGQDVDGKLGLTEQIRGTFQAVAFDDSVNLGGGDLVFRDELDHLSRLHVHNVYRWRLCVVLFFLVYRWRRC